MGTRCAVSVRRCRPEVELEESSQSIGDWSHDQDKNVVTKIFKTHSRSTPISERETLKADQLSKIVDKRQG